MKIIQAEIYKCGHCGKVQFRKCDMSKHEKWCKKNPNNKHMCFELCQHLKKEEIDYEVEGGYDNDGYSGKRTIFTCMITSQKLFSFIAERRKLPVIKEEDTIRMPLECDKYNYGEYREESELTQFD